MWAATASAVLSRGQGSAFPPDPLSARTLCALDPVSRLSPTAIAPGSEASRRLPVPHLLSPLCFSHEARLSAEAPEMHPARAFQAAPTPAEVDLGRRCLPRGLTTKHSRRSKDDNR
ncbi:MAG: hypothetical protein DI601_23970 [Azospirillum brasilense]|nr:MAG: hypothetical protein DI601_23970 [Azospirillum brasilense]